MSKSDEMHTPTPWKCKQMFQGSHTPKRADILGPPGHREVAAVYWHVVDSDLKTARANAAFIVRAVNSHASLVAACMALRSAYDKAGPGDSVDWSDVDMAHELATGALNNLAKGA